MPTSTLCRVSGAQAVDGTHQGVGRERAPLVEPRERVRGAQPCGDGLDLETASEPVHHERPTAAPDRSCDSHRRYGPLAGELDHERPERRPQMKVLMGVEVGQRSACQGAAHRIELRVQLASKVGNVDPPCERARQETLPRQRQPAVVIDETRDLRARQQRWILPHNGQVDADTEFGNVVQHRRARREGGTERKR